MQSRLPVHLHPLAGRPLIWHTLAHLAAAVPSFNFHILADNDLPPDLLADFAARATITRYDPEADGSLPDSIRAASDGSVLLVDAAAADPAAIAGPLAGPGKWLLHDDTGGMAALSTAEDAAAVIRAWRDAPALASLGGFKQMSATVERPVVRDRRSLARLSQLVRDRLVGVLMKGGVTFLLPESVLVDIDVQIARDTVIYPGVVLEGETQIGEETVIGPGCRIIDSWVGSGVEMKGWNYISHTSIRNRAILEPYVRRGYD